MKNTDYFLDMYEDLDIIDLKTRLESLESKGNRDTEHKNEMLAIRTLLY